MKKWEFSGTAKDIREMKSFVSLIKELWDSYINIEISLFNNKRSIAQNKLYHMWIADYIDYTGYPHSKWHEVFKDYFLPLVSDEIYTSTTQLNQEEFTIFLNLIFDYAMDKGIPLRHPQDKIYEEELQKIINGN